MRAFIQWAVANPVDWTAYDFGASVNEIKNLPSKPEPPGGQGTVTLDNTPGWVAAVNVQGVVFAGYEHIGFIYERNPVRKLHVAGWNDEPADNPDGPYGVVWTFEFPRNDPRLNAINTVQTRTIYVAAGSSYAAFLDSVGVPWVPWTSFTQPPADQVRHCPWLTDQQYAAHEAVRNPHAWDEWVEGQ